MAPDAPEFSSRRALSLTFLSQISGL